MLRTRVVPVTFIFAFIFAFIFVVILITIIFVIMFVTAFVMNVFVLTRPLHRHRSAIGSRRASGVEET